MPGPQPKDPSQRRRRHKVSTAVVLVPPAGRVTVPKLPPSRYKGGWLQPAKEYWVELWRSPMAAEWQATDRFNLLICTELVDSFFRCDPGDARGKAELAGQLRLMERELGLTPMSRRSLQWAVEKVEEAQDAGRRRRAGRPRGGPDPRLEHVIDAEVVEDGP